MKRLLHPRLYFSAGCLATGFVLLHYRYPLLALRFFVAALVGVLIVTLMKWRGV